MMYFSSGTRTITTVPPFSSLSRRRLSSERHSEEMWTIRRPCPPMPVWHSGWGGGRYILVTGELTTKLAIEWVLCESGAARMWRVLFRQERYFLRGFLSGNDLTSWLKNMWKWCNMKVASGFLIRVAFIFVWTPFNQRTHLLIGGFVTVVQH